MKKYISIDIGGTAIKHGILTKDLVILEKGQIETESHLGGTKIIEKVSKLVKQALEQDDILGIAISTAGMVDSEKGEIIYANALIPDYSKMQIKKILETTFHLPCEVENDVNCAGLAEALTGCGKGKQSCLCLTIGTGIGGAFILNNEIYRGFSNSACEIGYLLIGDQEFQEIGSTKNLVEKIAKKRKCSTFEMNGKIIFEEAKKGDPDCIKAIDDLVDVLAKGIGNCVYILNPEIVILGGGIMAQKEYLNDRIKKALKKQLIPRLYETTSLAFAKNENDAGMIGALIHFLKKLKNE